MVLDVVGPVGAPTGLPSYQPPKSLDHLPKARAPFVVAQESTSAGVGL